jgi:hypothetical protein
MSYLKLKELAEEMARSYAEAIDYEFAWGIAERIQTSTTKYSGKGRPRKTDYDIYKHPFDGKLRIIKN